jgi:hypothetical protein
MADILQLLPVFMLRKAQLRWKVKITIIVVLGLGAVLVEETKRG